MAKTIPRRLPGLPHSLRPLSTITVSRRGHSTVGRSRGKQSTILLRDEHRPETAQVLVGVGKGTLPISFSVGLSKSQMEESLPTLLRELDREAYKIPRVQVSWRYAGFGLFRNRYGETRRVKRKPLTKPLRVVIPVEAKPFVRYFDRVARESSDVEFQGRLKRVQSMAKVLGRNTDARSWSDGFVQRDFPVERLPSGEKTVLRYVAEKPFVLRDPRLLSTLLGGVAQPVIARAILDRFKTRLGEKKYRQTILFLEDIHRSHHFPAEVKRVVPLHRFIRKIRSRDKRYVLYDYFPPRTKDSPIASRWDELPSPREAISYAEGLRRYGNLPSFAKHFERVAALERNPYNFKFEEMRFRSGLPQEAFAFYHTHFWRMTRKHYSQLAELYARNPKATIRDVEKELSLPRDWARWVVAEYRIDNPTKQYSRYNDAEADSRVWELVAANPDITDAEIQHEMNVTQGMAAGYLWKHWYKRSYAYLEKNPTTTADELMAALKVPSDLAVDAVESFRKTQRWLKRKRLSDEKKARREIALRRQLDEGALYRLAYAFVSSGNRAVVKKFVAFCTEQEIPIPFELAQRVLRQAARKWRAENQTPF